MRQDPRFSSIVDGVHYYSAFCITTQQGVICSEVFWRKRDAQAELRDNPEDYRATDRVSRVFVSIQRGWVS